MIEVLFFADRAVRERLFAWVERKPALLLVTAVRAGKWMKPPAEREPFAALEQAFGATLTQVLVADEGTVEGMWRDPLGDLADALFPEDAAGAYTAAGGYLVLVRGEVETVVKKSGSAADDRWFLQETLASAHRAIPRPDPAERPGPKRRRTEAPTEAAERDRPAGRVDSHPPTPEPETAREQHAEPPLADPWMVLGVARGSTRAEARRMMRALVAQYHPDKVAHLAGEFRELAEVRTREILGAWERLEAELPDE